MSASQTSRSVPARLSLLSIGGGVCIISSSENRDAALSCLQSIVFEMLNPELGDFRFLLYDGTGGGANLRELTRIPSDAFIGGRILTMPEELNRELTILKQERVNVIQNVLGCHYKNIFDYNDDHTSGKKLAFTAIFVADFPKNVSKEDAEFLKQLINDRGLSGIFVFLHIDGNSRPDDSYLSFDPVQILKLKPVTLIQETPQSPWTIHFHVAEELFNKKYRLHLSTIPSEEELKLRIEQFKERKAQQNKAVSLVDTLYTPQNLWSKSASHPVSIPVGIDEYGDQQIFSLPEHGMVAGVTGSGKSVLLHDIILGGSWLYSPKELQFVLLDYKEGVEFYVYENLPHVRVLSIEADRSYGKRVLDYIEKEFNRRSKTPEAMKELGFPGKITNVYYYNEQVDEYNKNNGTSYEHIPILIIVIDEFQVLLEDDNTENQLKIFKLLTQITKQGRSMGIHLLLSTQTPSEVHVTPKNISLRISLQLNSFDDCNIIMQSGNNAPMDLPKYHAVYNEKYGNPSDNRIFKPAFLDESKGKKDISKRVKSLALEDKQTFGRQPYHEQYIYYGPQPVSFLNTQHRRLPKETKADETYIWLGERDELVNDHAGFYIKQQPDSNILLIGNDELSVLSVIYYTAIQFEEQHSRSCFLFDNSNGHLKGLIPQNRVTILDQKDDMQNAMKVLDDELKLREQDSNLRSPLLVIMAYTESLKLFENNAEGDPPPEFNILLNLLKKGSEVGIHILFHARVMSFFSSLGTYGSKLDTGRFNIQIAVQGNDTDEMFSDYALKKQVRAMPANSGAAILRIADEQTSEGISVYEIPPPKTKSRKRKPHKTI